MYQKYNVWQIICGQYTDREQQEYGVFNLISQWSHYKQLSITISCSPLPGITTQITVWAKSGSTRPALQREAEQETRL